MQAPEGQRPRRRRPAVEVASHTKSLEIALQRPCDNRWPPGRPKARKVVPKAPKKEPKSHKCPPKGASDMTFCQTGRPSENMRRRVRIACPDPRRCLGWTPFPPKGCQRARLENCSLKDHHKSRKVAPRVPQGCPKDPKWHPGSPKIIPKSHSGPLGRQGRDCGALGGTPPAENDLKKRPRGI